MIHYKRKNWFLVFIIAVFLFFLSNPDIVFAGENSKKYRLNQEFIRTFWNDFQEVVTSAKDWKKRDIYRLSAVLAAGTLFLTLDDEINDWFQENQSSWSEDASQVFSPLGHGAFLGGFLTVLYASGEVLDSNKLRKTALISFESWIISGVIVNSVKFLVGRVRPLRGRDSFTFHPFSLSSRFHSFPSGHASSAFAVATVIADQSEKWYVDVLAYNLATLAALSRIHDGKHWMTDIFMGAALGYCVAKRVSAVHREKTDKKIKVSFQFTPNQQSITLSIYL